jgi:hypothetical protein
MLILLFGRRPSRQRGRQASGGVRLRCHEKVTGSVLSNQLPPQAWMAPPFMSADPGSPSAQQ